jgi:hypothetical protein
VKPFALTITYDERGDNIETLRFSSRRVRDDAARVFAASDFVRLVERWDELGCLPLLVRRVVEGVSLDD